jgi:hypothetical protein
VTGFESGDGLPMRPAASDEELRGGMLISLGRSCFSSLSSGVKEGEAGFPVGPVALVLRFADCEGNSC